MSVSAEIKDGFVSIDGFDTLPKLFRNRAEIWGDRIAMREKSYGIWESFTWKEFNNHARKIAAGLLCYGINPGDGVAILSEANKEWAFADMATMATGGIINGIYPTYQVGQVSHSLKDSKARFLFVENEEQLDKYLSICDELPDIAKVFVMDWKGLGNFSHEKVESLSHLYKLGSDNFDQYDHVIDEKIDAGGNDDVAVLVYTSGTTDAPQGAQIQHRYLLFLMSLSPDPLEICKDDELLTYLPLCHMAERVISLCLNMGVGTRINFAESSQTVFQNLQELSPTVLFAVPRIWEKFYSRVTTMMAEATWIGRKMYDLALFVGIRRAKALMADQKPSAFLEIGHKLADWLVFKNLKELLGLDRTRYLLTGAAPVSADLLEWYLALGLKIEEAYGQTEAGFATMTRKNIFRPGTVGRPLKHVEVKLDD